MPVLPVHRPQRQVPASAGDYGRAWRRLRRLVLRLHPFCVDPFGHHAADGRFEVATEVDHIVPRRAGGKDVIENLQSLCITCHSRKTARFDGGFGRMVSSGESATATTRDVMKIDSG
ncbi:MAG: HNH endonuclease [Planctomycetes bacterium]|nr:HNH endonuclease [Planctomycetota bacterium]